MQEFKELTPEKHKEIAKIVSKAQRNLTWITIKFSVGLFFINTISIVAGTYFLKDMDAEMAKGFQVSAMVINFAFMARYLYQETRKINDKVAVEVKEVLKNNLESEK